MPRKDPTFTDLDLVRFYCKNLDPAEKARVLNRFRMHIVSKTPICQLDPEPGTDWCKWARQFWHISDLCEAIGKWLPKVLIILTVLNAALYALSWAGWIGRLIAVIRAAVSFLLTTLLYITALCVAVGHLKPFAEILMEMFCFAKYRDLEGEPPNIDNLPESPIDQIDGIEKTIRDFFGTVFSTDTTTPPDYWPPDFPIGP